MAKGINKKSKEKEQKSYTSFRGSESHLPCGAMFTFRIFLHIDDFYNGSFCKSGILLSFLIYALNITLSWNSWKTKCNECRSNYFNYSKF
jgi:hypothetical protein